jgi:hypothetical protein
MHQRAQPLGDRLLQMSRLAVIEDGDLTKWHAQIAIVVNQNVRQAMDCRLKIVQGSREPGQQLVVGNVVTALRRAHSDALGRLLGTGESDVSQRGAAAG